jgi:hypothetical protein
MSVAMTVAATAKRGQPAAITPPAATGCQTAELLNLPPAPREDPRNPDIFPAALISFSPSGSTGRNTV